MHYTAQAATNHVLRLHPPPPPAILGGHCHHSPSAKCFFTSALSPSLAAKPVPPLWRRMMSLGPTRLPLNSPSGLMHLVYVSSVTTSPATQVTPMCM